MLPVPALVLPLTALLSLLLQRFSETISRQENQAHLFSHYLFYLKKSHQWDAQVLIRVYAKKRDGFLVRCTSIQNKILLIFLQHEKILG